MSRSDTDDTPDPWKDGGSRTDEPSRWLVRTWPVCREYWKRRFRAGSRKARQGGPSRSYRGKIQL